MYFMFWNHWVYLNHMNFPKNTRAKFGFNLTSGFWDNDWNTIQEDLRSTSGFMYLQQYFSHIVHFIVWRNWNTWKNHWLVTSHQQTLSHRILLITPPQIGIEFQTEKQTYCICPMYIITIIRSQQKWPLLKLVHSNEGLKLVKAVLHVAFIKQGVNQASNTWLTLF